MSLSDPLRVMAAMIELEIRRVSHDSTELFLRAIQPLLWLVLFGGVIGTLRAIPTGGIPYIDYLTPGVLIQSTVTVSTFFGLVIIWERESGILKKLVAAPSPRYAIVIGRSMAAGVRGVFQAFIILPFAFLLGVHLVPNPLYLLTALVVVFISCGGFASLSILIASLMKTRERFMGIGQAITLPLFFLSNAIYPIEAMPPLLRVFAIYNPMTYIVSAVRALLITGDLSGLLLDIAVIIGFDAFMFAIASFEFKNIIE